MQRPQTRRQIPSGIRKQGLPQGVPFSPRLRRQLNPFNAHGNNANFAQSNMRKMNNVIRTMATNITALRKENAELKAKLAEAQKNSKTQ